MSHRRSPYTSSLGRLRRKNPPPSETVTGLGVGPGTCDTTAPARRASMTNQLPRVHEIEHHAAERATTRPVVSGMQGVMAAGHPLVSMAGTRMLLAGGNAFDAAAAAGFAAAVVEPTASYTLCGECVAMVYDARRRESVALSGQGTAPAAASIDAFRRRGLDRIPTGPGRDAHLSFTVPGAVDAYLTLLETYGTKPLREVLAPAVHYAERGFPMYEYMHRMLAIPDTRAQFALYPPGGDAVFYPNGRAPRVGERFVQPALAATLRRLVEADASGDRLAGIAAARERLYRGDVAALIGADPSGSRDAVGAAGRRPACGNPVGDARGRRRHDAHRRDRRAGQHDRPDAERRGRPQVRLRAGARLHAQHAQRDVRARGRSPQRARTRQASAHDAGELSDL